jgi:foldase protein PrsA
MPRVWGQVAAPASFNNKWVLLVVRKLIPPSMKPLSQVSAQISERLSEERHAQALASFLKAYRQEWRAKTHCKAGFIVQRCAEYRGREVPEGNPLTGE